MTMRILAIETATPIGSAALLTGPEVVAEAQAPAPMRHLEWLAPAIQGMLQATGWGVEDVEGIAVSRGPGSFTGLRIGMATAAAWARARAVPIVGVSTLEAIAAGIDGQGTICVMLDARRGEYVAAVFKRTGGDLVRLTPDAVGGLTAALATVPVIGSVVFAGDGLAQTWAEVEQRLGPRAAAAPPEQWIPRARAVGGLGLRRLAAGETDDPYLLLPAYTRGPVRE